jgi:YD repeat-containing protein
MMRPLHVAVQLAFVAASALPLVTEAATCTVGAGVRTIGNEFFASAAYPDGSYEYQVTILLCSGGVPSYFNGTSFTGTPAAVIQAYRSLNSTRVFRNQCGSMGLIAHDRFLGTIDDGVVAVDLGLSAHPLNATYIDEFVKGIAPGEGFPIPCGCTGGLARLPGSVACTPPPAAKAPDLCVGNPIVPGQGCKVHWETDYTFGGASPLNFKRYYHSQSPYHDRSAAQRALGNRWRHNHDVLLNPAAGANLVLLLRDDGQILYFRPKAGSATDWVSDADIVGQLKKTATGWTWRESDDAVETFDAAGRRLARVERGGLSLSYSYVPGSDRLAGIQDNFGRSLTLTYNAQNLLSELTTPAGERITYTYDGNGNLATVTRPDAHVRSYSYTSVSVGSNVEPALLTSLTDENANPYATWTYDTSALAASSEHAGGVDRHTFTYRKDAAGKITGSNVSNPLGAVTQYTFQNLLGANRVSTISQPLIAGLSRSFTYDANGNVASRTDFNGRLTTYTYDLTRNLEIRRVEASGQAEARTISSEWHASYRLPLRIAEPLKRTLFTYDDAGNTLSRSEQATTDGNGSLGFAAPVVGSPRTWTFTYNSLGQVLSADGPRSDLTDLTTYGYHDAADPDPGKRGNLATVTNALGHVSEVSAYDLDGRPLIVVDPNGLTTTLSYDPRGRLAGQTVGDEHTAYTYDPAGQLTRITLPDGSSLSYSWDAAHRLTQVTDSLGNTLTYTLDAAGNRIREDTRDPAGQLSQTKQRVHDALSRLSRELGSLNQLQAEYAYDPQGNLSGITTPQGAGTRSTTQAFDALNRLIRVTDPASGITQYAYDGQSQLIRVTDPRTLATRYTIDGLGKTSQLNSPDSGTTHRTFDAAGNELTTSDAKGQTTSRQYDALNRLTRITYADNSHDILLWDLGANGEGRLARIEQRDVAGTLVAAIGRQYDPHGRLTQETRNLAGIDYVTQYRYSSGRLVGVTYPSGNEINYTLDAQGQISEVRLTAGGQVRTLATAIARHPFGGIRQLTNGAGQLLTWGQDTDGRPSSYTLGNQTWQIAYDTASRIAAQTNINAPAQTASYGYDPLDRLTQAVLPSVTHGYGYDATGNRLSQTSGGATRSYTISPASNRLSAIAGSSARAYTYDANGSITGDGAGQTFAYDARGRLTGVTVAGATTTYRLDPLGQRIRKTGAEDTVYHYDQEGRLISETAPDGAPRKDYVWLGDQPLAIIQ